jgi:hypothetical protein
MNVKRLCAGALLGALLGVACIVGAQLRTAGQLETLYLFSFWFNRVLIGVTIGLAKEPDRLGLALLRGAVLGAVVSFGFYSATDFADTTGFGAGIVYGLIIEAVLFRTTNTGPTK